MLNRFVHAFNQALLRGRKKGSEEERKKEKEKAKERQGTEEEREVGRYRDRER